MAPTTASDVRGRLPLTADQIVSLERWLKNVETGLIFSRARARDDDDQDRVVQFNRELVDLRHVMNEVTELADRLGL